MVSGVFCSSFEVTMDVSFSKCPVAVVFVTCSKLLSPRAIRGVQTMTIRRSFLLSETSLFSSESSGVSVRDIGKYDSELNLHHRTPSVFVCVQSGGR